MKISLSILTLIFLNSCVSTLVRFDNTVTKMQEKIDKGNRYPNPIPFNLNSTLEYLPSSFRDIPIMKINKSNLDKLISFQGIKFKYILFYTSGCHGTSSELNYIRKSDSLYGEKVSFLVISSDNIANYRIQMLQKYLYNYRIFWQTYIIDESISSFLDDRKRGVELRNQICEECKPDIIGVPYVLLLNKSNEVMFHGYRGYKTEIPSDILTYFLKQKLN